MSKKTFQLIKNDTVGANETPSDKTNFNLGSKGWAAALKSRALSLTNSVTQGYVDLARILYTLDNTPVDGIKNNPSVISFWGYHRLEQFAHEELHMSARKLAYLRAIGYALEVELVDVDPHWKSRLVGLGWTKLREICRVIRADQLKDWVLQAEQASYKEVLDMVDRYLNEKAKADEIKSALNTNGASKDPLGPPVTSNTPVDTVATGANFSDTTSQNPTIETQETLIPVPAPERLTSKHFTFYDEQLTVVKQALERSKQLSRSDKESHNLYLICLAFLATNEFTTASQEQRLAYLTQFEKTMGFKLIISDDTNEVLYGANTLKDVLTSLSKKAN